MGRSEFCIVVFYIDSFCCPVAYSASAGELAIGNNTGITWREETLVCTRLSTDYQRIFLAFIFLQLITLNMPQGYVDAATVGTTLEIFVGRIAYLVYLLGGVLIIKSKLLGERDERSAKTQNAIGAVSLKVLTGKDITCGKLDDNVLGFKICRLTATATYIGRWFGIAVAY